MEKQKCIQCNQETLMGEIRSGFISFGAYFIEYEKGKKTLLGTPKPKSGFTKNNRVVSYACKNCGYISNYLEDVHNKK